MIKSLRIFLLRVVFIASALYLFSTNTFVLAQSVDYDASSLIPRVDMVFSPLADTFEEGATFNMQIFLNTRGESINGINIKVKFDSDKLYIVQPSSGISIIGVWVEPPVYDNTKGTASYVGVVPGGITTSSGLIGTITFRAKKVGKASVSFDSNSEILFNDGLGTKAKVNLGRAEYNIIPKAPGGVTIFSETHPIESDWYINNSPIISWEQEVGVAGFSYVLDNKPFTIPLSTINTTNTTQFFENLGDGLWYFHIKSNKLGVWGRTGHFLIRIDTTPPADFIPKANYLLAATISVERTLVSFFTTDSLSGIDHYEVGIIDKSQPTVVSPVFVEAKSPFQVPLVEDSELHVIVRAFDKAGNTRESFIDIKRPFIVLDFLKNNIVLFVIFIILVILIGFFTHFFLGHHIWRGLKRLRTIINDDRLKNILLKNVIPISSTPPPPPSALSTEQIKKEPIETNNQQ